ncbi:MAG: DUF4124 domain-containing protein [Telluria sp.]
MNHLFGLRPAFCAALLLAASAAHAQYVWIDNKGIHHYSDRAPPPEVPVKNILKAPDLRLEDLQAAPAAAASPAPAAPEKKPPPTLAERNADFAKRQQERAAQAEKDAAEAKRRSELQEQCKAAMASKQQYESGARLGSVGPDGERVMMSDEERARNLARANQILEACR